MPNRAVQFPGQARAIGRYGVSRSGLAGFQMDIRASRDYSNRSRSVSTGHGAKMNQPRTGHRKLLSRRCGIRLPHGIWRVEDLGADLIETRDENVCARFPG